MSNWKEIMKGWGKYLVGTPLTPEQQKRAEICNGCPLAKFGKTLEEQDGEIVSIEGKLCGQCGCYLPAKIRVNKEKCPINKWKEII